MACGPLAAAGATLLPAIAAAFSATGSGGLASVLPLLAAGVAAGAAASLLLCTRAIFSPTATFWPSWM